MNKSNILTAGCDERCPQVIRIALASEGYQTLLLNIESYLDSEVQFVRVTVLFEFQ